MTAVLRSFGGKRPQIGHRVFLAETCAVIGDVVIGDESSIWYGVVLRGDMYPIRVGARTNLQDGTIVHITGGQFATTIGDDCTVGHGAIVHGCTIEDHCLIGMGRRSSTERASAAAASWVQVRWSPRDPTSHRAAWCWGLRRGS